MARYLRMLFKFGEFAGVGIKTGMGMGAMKYVRRMKMIDQKIKLITGSLLHDIGKVVYREGSDRRNHSVSGYDFLKEEGKIEDKEILDCVRYHHFFRNQKCTSERG